MTETAGTLAIVSDVVNDIVWSHGVSGDATNRSQMIQVQILSRQPLSEPKSCGCPATVLPCPFREKRRRTRCHRDRQLWPTCGVQPAPIIRHCLVESGLQRHVTGEGHARGWNLRVPDTCNADQHRNESNDPANHAS